MGNVAKKRNVEVAIEGHEVVQDLDHMIELIVDRGQDHDHLRKSRKKAQKAWDREREKLRKKEQEKEQRLAMETKLSAEDLVGKTEEEIDMMKMMGFNGFNTSKGKKVKGNDVGDVHVAVKRKYRQYMNRKGGFNSPLDYVH